MNPQPPAVYLLDTNVFVEAHRRYYALDLCPGFWDCLAHHCQTPRLLSIDRVKDEITGGDALAVWAEQAPHALFVSTAQQAVVSRYAEVMTWVHENPQFRPEAKAEFARGADGWVIAYAEVHGLTLVTHEAFDPNARKRVPIPNVCRQFGVPTEDTFAMLRRLEVQFGWAPS